MKQEFYIVNATLDQLMALGIDHDLEGMKGLYLGYYDSGYIELQFDNPTGPKPRKYDIPRHLLTKVEDAT